ncbi:MAG: hypothetical protein K9M11_01210 [Candidatus Pacebacteria bacterium]|nr:hypothetical protein [Candidatus Paceibacterota bacterium]
MKKAFYDIIPNEKRSIRNIPITKKTDVVFESKVVDEVEIGKSAKNGHTINEITETNLKIHHSRQTMDGIRSKSSSSHESKSSYIEIEPEIVDEDLENPVQVRKGPTKIEDDTFDEEESFEEWRNTKNNSFWRAWVALAVLASAGIAIFSIFFTSATITINPVKHDLVLKESNLALDLIKHEDNNTEISKSTEITANGTIKVDRKATGKVVLYNAYNSSTQKLVGGTRLQTPNGLIYKLKTTVNIPAQKTVSGKKVPGSIEAEIEASESGDKYNQGLKDFSVVAYKGSDMYDSIYGRSKTSLTNGFSGTVPNITSKDTSSAVSSIKDEIAKEADSYFAKLVKSKGDTFAYVPTTKQTSYGETKQEVSKDGKTATITISAKVSAMIFDSTSLFEQIIKMQSDESTATSSDISATATADEIVYTGDLSKLIVNISKDSSSVSVSGTTTISSAIDVSKVAKAVSGLEKEQAIGAIKRLVELETIEIDIRPWWNKKLPSSDKIEIKTEE